MVSNGEKFSLLWKKKIITSKRTSQITCSIVYFSSAHLYTSVFAKPSEFAKLYFRHSFNLCLNWHHTHTCTSTIRSKVGVYVLKREKDEERFLGWMFPNISRTLRGLEQLYLVLFLNAATSFKGFAVGYVVSAVMCVQSYKCLYTCVSIGYVCDIYICPHACVYEYYFALFVFVIPCCVFLPTF